MANSYKIICSSGSTINKSNLNINLKNNNLFVGTVFNKFHINDEYLTILDFNLNSISLNEIDSAFLNIYIKSLKSIYNNPVTLCIYENLKPYLEYTLNPKSISLIKSHTNTSIEISSYDINKYVKIDITPILISLISSKKSSSITIKLSNLTSSTIINFESFSSKNAPFIEIINSNNSNIEVEFNTFKNTINNKICELSETITQFNNVINTTITNNTIENEKLIDNKLYQITKNIDTLSKKINTIEANLSDKANDINEINNNILMILSKIDTLNKQLNLISITPIDLN